MKLPGRPPGAVERTAAEPTLTRAGRRRERSLWVCLPTSWPFLNVTGRETTSHSWGSSPVSASVKRSRMWIWPGKIDREGSASGRRRDGITSSRRHGLAPACNPASRGARQALRHRSRIGRRARPSSGRQSAPAPRACRPRSLHACGPARGSASKRSQRARETAIAILGSWATRQHDGITRTSPPAGSARARAARPSALPSSPGASPRRGAPRGSFGRGAGILNHGCCQARSLIGPRGIGDAGVTTPSRRPFAYPSAGPRGQGGE